MNKRTIDILKENSTEKLEKLYELVDDLLEHQRIEELKEVIHTLHPADIAELINHLDEDGSRILFEQLDDKTAARVLVEVEGASQETLLDSQGAEKISRVVDLMHSDDAADIIKTLDPDEAREVLARIEPEDSAEVKMLMEYPEESAGGIMATEFVSVPQGITVGEAIEIVRSDAKEIGRVIYVYAVDDKKRLMGVLPLSRLVLADPDASIHDTMLTDIVSVPLDKDQEDVGRIMAKYNLSALPVVDAMGRIVGIVTFDDVMDVVEEEATEDILRLVGASETEIQEGLSSYRAFTMRMPWLLVCFLGELVTGFVLLNFEPAITRLAALVFFIPLIAAMGGNIGMQSSTILIRGIATGDINYLRYGKRVMKELRIGLMIGISAGAVLGITGYMMQILLGHPEHSLPFGIILSSTMVVVLTSAAFWGAYLPVIFKKVGIDPAVATGPLVTTINDVLGMVLYFSLALSLMNIFEI